MLTKNFYFLFKALGGSLQKDLNVATQALEDVALGSANVATEVSKEIFNPLAKFTKVQYVVLYSSKSYSFDF